MLVTQMNSDGELAYFPDDCPDDYEIAANGYFAGFIAGCVCPGSSFT